MRNTTDQRRDHAWESRSVPAERYEEDLVPLFFERWAQDLVARAAPLPGERVLDLACGPESSLGLRLLSSHQAP